MTEPTRKLAAIVFTDIVGFTKLTADDQSKASSLLKQQRDLLRPIVESFNGSWIKEIGDGLLLIFDTVTDAVNCSIKIQEETKSIDDLDLRIGIHQGEILLEENDVIGDDVNIASRIEPFSASGGIAISNKVNDALVREKEFETKYLGKPKLKGVGQRVEVFCITSHGLPETKVSKVSAKLEPEGIQWNVFSLTGAVLTVIGVLFWINVSFLGIGIASDNEIPSLVILPFENKGEAKDEYYSYGISSDIISDITSIGQLRVASLNSVEEMQKDGLKNIEIADKLSSRYVVSGSLWKIDSIFQLSLELFDTEEEMLLVSERWETNWSELSLVKDELTKKIIEGLSIKIINELDSENVVNADAYEYYLKAKHTYRERKTIKDNKIARGLLNKALSIDSNFVDAEYLLANTYHDIDRDIALKKYKIALKTADRLDDKKAKMDIKTSMGDIYSEKWDTEKSLKLYREAYKLSKEIGNESSIASALNGLGRFFWERREGDSARYYWQESYDIIKRLGDKSKLVGITNDIGLVYWEFDSDLDKAILAFEESLALEEAINSFTGIPLSNLGVIYHNKEMYQKSKEYYDRVLDHSVAVDDRNGIGFIKYYIGVHYEQLFEYRTAIEYFRSSYEINKDLGIERWKSSSLRGLVICHHILDEQEISKKYFDLAAEINTKIVNSFYKDVGSDLLKYGNYSLSRVAFNKQLIFEKENDNRDGIISTLTNIGLSYFYEGSYSEALNYFDQSIEYDGIKDLVSPVETLVHKYLSQSELGLPINIEHLKALIEGFDKNNQSWYENEPEYINWALYELFGDEKYIIEAKNKIDSNLKNIKHELHVKYLSYPFQKKIMESFNRMKNI